MECEFTPLYDDRQAFPPDETADACRIWPGPAPDRPVACVAPAPRAIGLAKACEDGGDWTPREEPTDRLIVVFRVMLRVVVIPLRVTVRVLLRLRLTVIFRPPRKGK